MTIFQTRVVRFLAVLSAFLFSITLFAALLLVNAEARLFDASTYKKALVSENLYERMPKLLAEQVIANLNGMELFGGQPAPAQPAKTPSYLKYLTVQDWELLIAALVPPEQMQTISEATLDSIFDFLNGKNENPVIPISPVKQTLAANSEAALTSLLTAKPSCTIEQQMQILTGFLTGQPSETGLLCNPPAELLPQIMPFVSAIFNEQIFALPANIPLFEQNRYEIRVGTDTLRIMMRLSLLVPLAFLLMVTLLVVRSLAGWLKWWGIPLTISALLMLLAALTGGSLTRMAVTYAASQENSMYALRLAITVMDVIEAIVRQVTTPLGIQAVIILIIGLVMLAGTWFVPQRNTFEA